MSCVRSVRRWLAPASSLRAEEPGVPPKPGWKLVWHDEFDGTELDQTKWSYRYLGMRESSLISKDSVSLDGHGHLLLTVKEQDGKLLNGMIGTPEAGWMMCMIPVGIVLAAMARSRWVDPLLRERSNVLIGIKAAAIELAKLGCTLLMGLLTAWLLAVLNVVTGNLDRVGGMMFTKPAVDFVAIASLSGQTGHYAKSSSRVRGLPEFGGEYPVSTLAEEIETPGQGQIRALVTSAGNPVLSTPNGARLAKALETLDFMVSIDIYVNETTRHAHLILPPVGPLERSHYDAVLHALAVRNTAKYSPPVLPRPDGGKTDWEILWELGMRLGGMRFNVPVVDGALKALWRAGYVPDVDHVVDLALRIGPYGDRWNPLSKGLSLAKLKRAPHGVDLGPLAPAGREKVRTADGKVDLAPTLLVEDVPRLARWIAEPSPALALIGRRHVRTNNSWMHNCRSLVKGPDRSALLLHPDDAKARGIAAGEMVRVRSRVGAIEARVEVTDEVMRGVVCLPHGYGHAAAADTMRVAGAVTGPNVNAITDDHLLDPVSGTAALSGVPVEIERIGAVAAAS